MLNLISTALLLVTAQANPGADDIVQKSFRDATFVGKISMGNKRELAKINKDFVTGYDVQRPTRFWIKEPFMLRGESSYDDTQVVFILNGPTRRWKVPKMSMNLKQDLTNQPGKWQTVFDFGLLTPSLFKDFFIPKFIRTDRSTSEWVFDLTYPTKMEDTSRHRIWVDPKTHLVTKREWYNQNGDLMATFLYENPKQVNGVWFSTKATVKNSEGKIAGVSNVVELQINTGLADSLFDVG